MPPLPLRTSARRLTLLPLVLLLSLLLLAPAGGAAPAPRRNFDIPAGAASVTLRQFAEQAGTQLLYPMASLQGITSRAIQG